MEQKINYSNIHFIGIGGISMSGIASILLKWGYFVSGSDSVDSDILQNLKKQGAITYVGHEANNIKNPDLVVYTAAISKDNPELLKAKELGIKVMERADFLGELTKLYNKTIAISGTHGKTTTTSMISICFIEADFDPSVQVGSILPQINGNYKIGNSDYFIIEACEYVDSFLKFYPQTEIILNIEKEHLDYFKDIYQIKDSFKKFINKLPENGNLIINIDSSECIDVLKTIREDINIYTYSIKDETADIYGFNIRFDDDGFGLFDVKYNNQIIKNIKLNVPGIHNVSNACACFATCIAHNISAQHIKTGLEKFNGSSRRFEFKGKTKNNVTIIDDYAHHPTEIKALLQSARNTRYNEIWAVFQPHTFSRVKTLLDEFETCFEIADHVILTDIYAAREIDDGSISSEMLVDLINKKTNKNAIYISNFDDIAKYINENAKPNDLVLTIGAGTITKLSKCILDE